MSFLLSSFLWTGGQYENIMQPNNVFEELEKDGFFCHCSWRCGGATERKSRRETETIRQNLIRQRNAAE